MLLPILAIVMTCLAPEARSLAEAEMPA